MPNKNKSRGPKGRKLVEQDPWAPVGAILQKARVAQAPQRRRVSNLARNAWLVTKKKCYTTDGNDATLAS